MELATGSEEFGIDALLGKLELTSISQRAKGDSFERLIKEYLLTDPLYAEQLANVWLWSEWPDREGSDAGIDLVARTHADEYWAIQCKFYSGSHTVAKADIDSFFTASGRSFFTRDGTRTFANRLIFTTTDHWSTHAERAIGDQTIPVTRIGRANLAEAPIDWSRFDWEEPSALYRSTKKHLRPHQREAIDRVIEGFRTHDRGQLIMACGTGKTFTSLRLMEETTPPGGTVLFLAPSISLIGQSLREWTAESSTPFVAFAVCSDTKVGKANEDIRTVDLAFVTTTNPATLVKDLSRVGPDERKVIFATYQSIQAVIDAQRLGNLADFDLVICDEAHRTTGITLADEDASVFTRVHDASLLRARKRLYMTATPRIYADASKQKAGEKSAALYSMDDEATFGPEFHRLGFGQSVDLDLLSDYKVLIVAEDEALMAGIANKYNALTFDETKAIDTDFAAKVFGSWRCLSRDRIVELDEDGTQRVSDSAQPMSRAVSFAKSIAKSKQVAEAFGYMQKLYENETGIEDRTLVACDTRHVDGTMNALSRQEDLGWLRQGAASGECRILTNARCLSEGIDVPALDAVVFFDTRDSMVDIVQAVGRVMRKAPGKDYGYIVLPVCLPSSEIKEFDRYIDSDNRFKGIWKVIKALRAHDESLVDEAEFRRKVRVVGRNGNGEEGNQLDLPLGTRTSLFEMSEALYAVLPTKLGDREYWSDWARNVAEIAKSLELRIRESLSSPQNQEVFEEFVASLVESINSAITEDEAIEMLVQHTLTRPIFDGFFGGTEFASSNPVSQSLETVIELLEEQSVNSEAEGLKKFYDEVARRISNAKSDSSRQALIKNLYDTFFTAAFPAMADRLGIVYTPIEIVDYILRSVNDVLRIHFGKSLSSPGVRVLDPFTGTGTFIVRILQLGLIEPEHLTAKYRSELFANEIVLLAYYIAAVNIETAYHAITQEHEPFEGIVLTDTFQMYETTDIHDDWMLTENHDRIQRERAQEIRVIVGNPPYSALQGSANDNNANLGYERLDGKIRDTYAASSTSTNKNSLYDSYIRALRWASDRIDESGVIGFVTNGYFLDSQVGDGIRKTFQDEFSHIYIVNLRGDQRTAGDLSRREGGKVFGSGSRARVAITILVKDPAHTGPVEIHYHDIGDYLSREAKLAKLDEAGSLAGTEWSSIVPNEYGDWLSDRDPAFETYLRMGNKKERNEPAIFEIYSAGVKTNRDAWAYNFSADAVASNMERMIEAYNGEVEKYQAQVEDLPKSQWPKVEDVVDLDPTRVNWDSTLIPEVVKGRVYDFDKVKLRLSLYRPFTKEYCYFDRVFINSVHRLFDLFPTPAHENVVIAVSGIGARIPFSAIATDRLPDIQLLANGQCFPLYYYTPNQDDAAGLFGGEKGAVQGGYVRREAITDWALKEFRNRYGDETIAKLDIFHYIYGILHVPAYRARFGETLKKMLPRIPFVEDFSLVRDTGRALMELHVNYEDCEPYPLGIQAPMEITASDYRVEKMRFGKVGKREDRSTIVYNSAITITGIPLETYEYVVNGRNPLEWMLDRYQVKTDKDSGIVNDPNGYSDDPNYIVNLIAKLVTLSVETKRLVDQLSSIQFAEAVIK
ncbi:type ISP restriction/modification enzyme [Ferrimicrobium sp.]|uniref:DEAD/DEAH box helicase n=1 Tax=Ferrimicrobium sp. TaxID=2926050 RepID=UPI00262F9AAB|nr:type ISP restriction/modification enzyme [Ferrimicrobium sp.]